LLLGIILESLLPNMGIKISNITFLRIQFVTMKQTHPKNLLFRTFYHHDTRLFLFQISELFIILHFGGLNPIFEAYCRCPKFYGRKALSSLFWAWADPIFLVKFSIRQMDHYMYTLDFDLIPHSSFVVFLYYF
jgi:hypothetical protein